MATPNYQEEIDSLREQLAAGTLVTSTDGTTTTHGGVEDLKARIAFLEDLQRKAQGKPRRRPVFNRFRLG